MPHARIRTSYDLGPEGVILIASTEADPAAGAEISVTVPGRAAWELLAFRFTLDTDGTAATRRPVLTVDDGTSVFLEIPPVDVPVANEVWTYTFGYGLSEALNAVLEMATYGIPPLTLLPGWRIRTVTANLQAGDNFDAPVLYLREIPQRGLAVGQEALLSALRRLVGEEASSG